MIYLHTSALIRLAGSEDGALAALLAQTADGMAVCSAVSGCELASTRLPSAVLRRARAVLDSPPVVVVEVSALVRESAESLADDLLEPAQAVHLATALSLGSAVAVFACDDPVLCAAAASRGMRQAVPPFGSRLIRRPTGGNRESEY
jgi:PIN domain